MKSYSDIFTEKEWDTRGQAIEDLENAKTADEKRKILKRIQKEARSRKQKNRDEVYR